MITNQLDDYINIIEKKINGWSNGQEFMTKM